MSMTKEGLLDFMRGYRYGVEASHTPEGPPEAALVGFVVNKRFELFFDCFDSTRKVTNLRRNPRIAFVIGGHEPSDERTVQYEGEVDIPTGAELEYLKNEYFAVHPDGLRRSKLPQITYFRVRPRWIRYTNLNVVPAQIVVFRGSDLRTDEDTGEPAIARAVTQMRGPWQPKIEREPEFNAFAKPWTRTGEWEEPPLEPRETHEGGS